MIGLNVGSGQRRFEICEEMHWCNVDLLVRPDQHPDVQADGFYLPFRDGCADWVVLHHVLEHFGCNEGAGLVRECWRILRHAGRLLVCVPNARALARRWLDGGITDYIFAVNIMGAYQGDEADRHRWLYTPESLWFFLEETCSWTLMDYNYNTEPPGADIARDWWTLEVVCVK